MSDDLRPQLMAVAQVLGSLAVGFGALLTCSRSGTRR